MDDTRHLAASTLYKEDSFKAGHASVWGSFFDLERQRWGYACCRGLSRDEACPHADAPDPEEGQSSEEEDAAAKALRVAWKDGKLLDADPPEELAPKDAMCPSEDFLGNFVLYWFHHWKTNEKPDKAQLDSTRSALLKLMQQLNRKAVDGALLSRLVEFADMAQRREYAQANDVYVNITIGKATWHSPLDLGEQRAHWGQGCSLRTMQRQVVEKDMKNASAFDTDPVVQSYVHALKRMVTYMQTVQPSADPSKQGHVPAPRAKADEVGLPVRPNIRDSDGRGHSPEFVDVNDASARDAQRGIAFGSRENGRAHPFVGIGFARGI